MRFPCFFSMVALLASTVAAPATAADKPPRVIWCIGDSITQSNADDDPQGSPRKSLHDLLAADGWKFSFTGHHAANPDGLPATGTTPEADLFRYHSGISGSCIAAPKPGRTDMTKSLPEFWRSGRLAVVKPDIILIMLGTNDVNGGGTDPAGAPARLEEFVKAVHALPGAGHPAVFIATIPPCRIEADSPAKVAAFNAALPPMLAKLRAAGADVTLVDVFAALDNHYDTVMRKDNLHPAAAGNAVIARCWFDAMIARGVAGK